MADREKASEASTKVQEVAANMQQAAATRKRISGSKAEAVARRYFAAIDARDLDDGRVAVGGRRPRERARPGRRARARGRARRSSAS